MVYREVIKELRIKYKLPQSIWTKPKKLRQEKFSFRQRDAVCTASLYLCRPNLVSRNAVVIKFPDYG